MVLCAFMSACDGGPVAPSADSYSGEWTGTTALGTLITFRVSPDDKVTSITVGYRFSGCSGSHTFSNLSLDTAGRPVCAGGICHTGFFREFNYTAGSPPGTVTTINGLFPDLTRAQGRVDFNYPGCGSALGVEWTAIRRARR
jgi:hypothetical protein